MNNISDFNISSNSNSNNNDMNNYNSYILNYIKTTGLIFDKISRDYNLLCNKHNLLLNNNDLLSYDTLVNLEVSMTDLSIQLQNITYLLNNEEYANANANANSNAKTPQLFEEEKKQFDNNDKIITQTIINMLPLFFMYFMMCDKDSIINSKAFGKSIKNKQKVNNTNTNDENKKNDETSINNKPVYNIPFIELD